MQRNLIDTFGGRHGLRDEGLLDSALEQSQATFDGELLPKTVFEQAAAYLFHLANNHAFTDGNKRIALAAMDTFLGINGLRLELSDEEAYDFVIKASTGEIDKPEIAEVLRSNTTRS